MHELRDQNVSVGYLQYGVNLQLFAEGEVNVGEYSEYSPRRNPPCLLTEMAKMASLVTEL